MQRQFCDRCGADVTDKPSASVQIVNDADAKGDGVVNVTADLCTRCRRALARASRRATSEDEMIGVLFLVGCALLVVALALTLNAALNEGPMWAPMAITIVAVLVIVGALVW